MMLVLVALIMGLAGSAHCAGMCVPLVMAYQHVLRSRHPLWITLYHIGRYGGYVLIATIGYTWHWAFDLAGWQQALSVMCGIIILLFAFRVRWVERLYARPAQRVVNFLSKHLYNTPSLPKPVLAMGGGFINGLLPCGLSYMAAAAAIAAPSYGMALLFMLAFALGTAPVLVFAVYGQKWIQRSRIYTRPAFQTTVLVVLSSMLILRGANLHIPYLSPAVKAHHVAPCCRK